MCSTQHCLSQALCTFWTPKTIPHLPTSLRRSWTSTTPRPCFVLLVHCPRAACADACGATMCSTQPCLPRAFLHILDTQDHLSPATPLHSPPHVPPRSMEQHYPHPLFLLVILRCPRAACNDACDACGLPSCCPPFSLASSPCASRLAPLHLPVPTCPSRLAPLHLLKMGGSETGGAWVGEGRRKGVGGAHGCGRGWGGKMEGSETVWLGCGRGWGVHGCGRLRG